MGEEQDVAAGPWQRQPADFFGDFAWALAHAGVGDDVGRIDGGGRLGLDDGRCRLARGRGMVRLGEGGSLAGPAAIASGLVAAVLSAVAGAAVACERPASGASGVRRPDSRGYSSGPGAGAAGTIVRIP